LRVPPEPLIVRAPPFRLPVNVAAPAVFDMVTVPEVVNAPMLWPEAVPVIVRPPEPLVVAPLFNRLPVKVSKLVPIASEAPEVSERLVPVEVKTLGPLAVITPVPLITTPPPRVFRACEAGHSEDTVLAELPALY